jgi:hypothetical protein
MFAEGAWLRRVDPRNGKITFLSHCPIELVRQIIPVPGTDRIIALTTSTLEELQVDTYDRNKLRCVKRSTLAPKSAPRAILSDDGRTLLVLFRRGSRHLATDVQVARIASSDALVGLVVIANSRLNRRGQQTNCCR